MRQLLVILLLLPALAGAVILGGDPWYAKAAAEAPPAGGDTNFVLWVTWSNSAALGQNYSGWGWSGTNTTYPPNWTNDPIVQVDFDHPGEVLYGANGVPAGSNFTVAVWFNPQGAPGAGNGYESLIGCSDASAATPQWYAILYTNTRVCYLGVLDAEGNLTRLVTPACFTNSAWHELTMRWTEGGTVDAFINGIAVTGSYDNTAATSIRAPLNDLAIGAFGRYENYSYGGLMGDLKLWQRGLSNAEIATNRNALKAKYGQ